MFLNISGRRLIKSGKRGKGQSRGTETDCLFKRKVLKHRHRIFFCPGGKSTEIRLLLSDTGRAKSKQKNRYEGESV